MLKIIKNCPSCDSILHRIGPNLFCMSKECPAKDTKVVENFATKIGIKGLGPITIKKLGLTKIIQVYLLTEDRIKEVIGEKLSKKLIEEINKTKRISLGKFLAACSIPLIGKTAGEKIDSSNLSIDELTNENCKNIGLGEKATNNLINWINTIYKDTLIFAPIEFIKITNDKQYTSYTVCISGKIPGYTKSKLKEILSKYGVEVKDSISKELDFLISEEDNTTKVNKAKQYNIPILKLDNFLEDKLNVKVE